MIQTLLVHPLPARHEQLREVFAEEVDLEITDCCDNIEHALTLLTQKQYDVIVADFTLAEGGALYLAQTQNKSKVLVTGVPTSIETIVHVLEEGAAGYVCEKESLADLAKQIRALYDNEFIVPPFIAAKLMDRLTELKLLVNELDGGNLAKPAEYYAELTQREWEVLRLIGQGFSNQQIAEALTVELGTVKNHVHNLLRKLDVCSRKQAAQVAQQLLEESPAESEEPRTFPLESHTWRDTQSPAIASLFSQPVDNKFQMAKP